MLDTSDRLAANEEQIAKLWTSHRELATVVWGDNERRDNGLRSKMRAMDPRISDIEDAIDELNATRRHYLDAERKATCLGIEALAQHMEEHKVMNREATDIRVAKINLLGQTWIQVVQLIGIIAAILIPILAK